MKNLLILLTVCALALTSCESKKERADTNAVETEKAAITNLDPDEFQEKGVNGIVLDVRTPAEVVAGKIPGSIAIDFYQDDFLSKATELPKDQEIFIYCAVGARSAEAAELLTQQGFAKVYHLSGGIRAWAAAGLPVTQE
jgi:rhodanese-related sulfurtransferase